MIGYPNGKTAARSVNAQPLKQSAGGRGMSLENDLNKTNEYYLQLDKAVIHKKPTPIQIVQVDYPKRSAAKITEAYFKVPSTTDYNGVYRGKAIDFEAKETRSKTSFPFSHIHLHQIEHLDRVLRQGAIAFVIVRFIAYDETYYVDAAKNRDDVQKYGFSFEERQIWRHLSIGRPAELSCRTVTSETFWMVCPKKLKPILRR